MVRTVTCHLSWGGPLERRVAVSNDRDDAGEAFHPSHAHGRTREASLGEQGTGPEGQWRGSEGTVACSLQRTVLSVCAPG